MLSYGLKKVRAWVDTLKDDPKALMARFEEEVTTAEKEGPQGSWEVPDLVTLVGAARAEVLLKRVLVLPIELRIEVGDQTRQLAIKLATKMVSKLKKPQWNLLTGISAPELALFELLKERFPRKEDADSDYERGRAEHHYLLGLIAEQRTVEAAKLAIELQERDGDGGSLLDHGDTEVLVRAGLTTAVQKFLRELLTKNPSLRGWEDFIRVSAQAGQAPASVVFLRETAARADLKPAAREMIQSHLWRALLAADEIEPGIKLLRELIVSRLEKARQASPAAKRTGRYSFMGGNPSEEIGELALGLAEVGRLLKRPEWVDEGVKAAFQTIADGRKTGQDIGRFVRKTAELLVELDRGVDAEQLLIEQWIEASKLAQTPNGGGRGVQEDLTALVTLYHRAGRSADVLKLLCDSKEWGAGDLGSILSVSSSSGYPLGYLAASALASSGQKDQARKILVRLLEDEGGFDPGYELLLQLGEAQDLLPILDDLAARDRFEERPLIWKALLQFKAGQLAEAEKNVRAAIAIDPSDGEQGKGLRMRAYAVLGDILEKTGAAEQARTMRGAVAAIRISENADDWWKAGMLSRAVKMYEEALTRFADAYCIQSRLALRYAELGDHEKAEEHYRRAYELMPESFGRVESHCFGCEGAFSGARAQGIADRVFTALAEKMPARAQVFYLLGYLRAEQERSLEAAEQYRHAIKLDPDYLNAWLKLVGVADKVALPRADHEAAALAILRLDPLGKHGGHSSYSSHFGSGQFARVSDFRALWKTLADGIGQKVAAEDGDLFVLTASKAHLEEASKLAKEAHRMNRQPMYQHGRNRAEKTPRKAGELFAQHAFLQQVGQLLQELNQIQGL